jgi:hypothetical protein
VFGTTRLPVVLCRVSLAATVLASNLSPPSVGRFIVNRAVLLAERCELGVEILHRSSQDLMQTTGRFTTSIILVG